MDLDGRPAQGGKRTARDLAQRELEQRHHVSARRGQQGPAIDAAWAQQRINNEPLTEIQQIKGASETHPGLSPNDEFANFEIMNFLIGVENSKSKLNGSYIREAYENGLAMQVKRGYNPYKMGVVGASDSHNTVVAYSQADNFGPHGMVDQGPKERLAGKVESGMEILKTGLSGARRRLAGVEHARVDLRRDEAQRMFAPAAYESPCGCSVAGISRTPSSVRSYCGQHRIHDGVPMGADSSPARSAPIGTPFL